MLGTQQPELSERADSALNHRVAILLMPVRGCFVKGNFVITLQSNYTELSTKQLEQQIGDFYLQQYNAQQQEHAVKFEDVRIFARAVMKYLLQLKNLPKYGLISSCQSRLMKTKRFLVDQRKFIEIVREEMKLSLLCKRTEETNITTEAPVKIIEDSKKQQICDRLYKEHAKTLGKISDEQRKKEAEILNNCTFTPRINRNLGYVKNSDLGVTKYVQQKRRQLEEEKQFYLEDYLQDIKNEAKYFKLMLSQQFIDEICHDLESCKTQSEMKKIVDSTKNLFQERYLDLQRRENKIKMTQCQRQEQLLKISYMPDEQLIMSVQKPLVNVENDIELHRLQRQILLQQEKNDNQLLKQKIILKQSQAEQKAGVIKQSMKGGGAFYLNTDKDVCHQNNSLPVTLYKAAI